MFENPRRGRQASNFTTNVPKTLDLKSSSEQIFFRKLSLGAPATTQVVICCGSKNSSKLSLSRFQHIDSCHGDSSIKRRDFTEVIILS